MKIFTRPGYRGPYQKGTFKVGYTKPMIAAEIIGIIAVIAIFGVTAWNYAGAPDMVPSHYNAAGEVDGYAGKGILLFVPIVTLLLYAGMTVVAFFPRAWNYPGKIKPEKLPLAEHYARWLLMGTKLLITALFIYTQCCTLSGGNHVSPLVMGLLIGAMFVLIIWLFVLIRKNCC